MLKLTDEQCEALSRRYSEGWVSRGTYRAEVEALLTAYHAMLATSPTHRVVEAPEGFEFDPSIANMLAKRLDYPFIQVAIKPIPKPCPPPKLEPVTVTVEQVYGTKPTFTGTGYEVVFNKALKLQREGFAEYLSPADFTWQPLSPYCAPTVTFICRKKWEGK